MSPLFAKHVDSDGKVMGVQAAEYSYQIKDWVRGLDFSAGDRIEFEALWIRKEEEEAPALSVVAS